MKKYGTKDNRKILEKSGQRNIQFSRGKKERRREKTKEVKEIRRKVNKQEIKTKNKKPMFKRARK